MDQLDPVSEIQAPIASLDDAGDGAFDHDWLAQACAVGGRPIRIGTHLDAASVGAAQAQRLRVAFARGLEEGQRAFLNARSRDDREEHRPLRDGLLAFGGRFALIPGLEEDLAKLMGRGQLWGATTKTMRGAPSQCHMNSCLLWEANQGRLYLATGYALSDDGLWRQHSWCVEPRPRSVAVIETTEPRLLYFGFVMDLDETVQFGDHNTDFGLSVEPHTLGRYPRFAEEDTSPVTRMTMRA